MSSIKILGIETSCDETSAAVVIDNNGKIDVLSNIIFSQIDIHKEYGGVVPEIASRNHIIKIDEVVRAALVKANVSLNDIDALAVTHAPGLVGALLVGVNFAKALAYATDLPLIAVHHIKGHIASNYIDHHELKPPFISLVVSGGHTQLVFAKEYNSFVVLGTTRDDAAGEAFDKVARSLNLPYPGGVEIEKLAKIGDNTAIKFPRAKLDKNSLDFSFSGLKSAVINYLNSAKMKNENINKADVAASFQVAAVDILVEKSINACKMQGINVLAVAGGVACNAALRSELGTACKESGINLYMPSPIYCTDNAAMIAAHAIYEFKQKNFAELDLNAVPSLSIANN